MYFPVSGWFAAFVVTLAVELPVAGYLLRRAGLDLLRLGLLIVFANLVTHPIVWFVIPQFVLVDTTTYTVAAETWAIAAEALFYWVAIQGLSARWALTVAIVANAASFLAGRLIGQLWPELFR